MSPRCSATTCTANNSHIYICIYVYMYGPACLLPSAFAFRLGVVPFTCGHRTRTKEAPTVTKQDVSLHQGGGLYLRTDLLRNAADAARDPFTGWTFVLSWPQLLLSVSRSAKMAA